MSDEPYAAEAVRIAERVSGRTPTRIRRFTTGSMHYVFEALFADVPALVIRIAAPYGVAAMRGASMLSAQLRPLAVPLPAIVAEDLDGDAPWLALERLPGSDLADLVAHLPAAALEGIADRVAAAQQIVARTPAAGRYGYAAAPQDAPHQSWWDVLAAHLERSRARIAAAGLFDPSLAGQLAASMQARRDEIGAVAATPFLHDTTTKNVIVTADGAFSGIVDVDDLCYGDPRYVVALTAASLLSMHVGTHYTDHWLQRTGRPNDSLFRLYVALFLLDFMSEHGQRFNGNERPSTERDRKRLQALLADTLAASRA